jgi:DNA-binding LytR/AlgR family response regulator
VVQFVLAQKFPVGGRLANLAIHVGAGAGLALVAITIAKLMAPLILSPDSPRLGGDLGDAIASDFLLLSFGLTLFAVLLHFPRSPEAKAGEASKPAPSYAQRIPVQTREGALVLNVDDVDWIEAQGNYAALHVGARTHVLRETLAGLVVRLDPARFVRIHRGAIVNLARVRRTKPLRSGDATVELTDGVELRASRTFAGALRETIARRA